MMGSEISRLLLLLILLASATVPAAAESLKEHKFGVVLIHGKWGEPSSRSLYPLSHALESSGVLLEMPEMPWSRSRYYDITYDAAMAEIDKAVEKLRAKGAVRVVVGGHSYGANAGLGYGARRDGVAGVLALAPGHNTGFGMARGLLDSVAQAKQLIAAGKGDEKMAFTDYNQGREAVAFATARVFLSHFDPEGPAAMTLNAARIRPGTPILWVIGQRDRLFARGKAWIYDKAPPHPKSRHAEVEGGHAETPTESIPIVLDWLKSLAQH